MSASDNIDKEIADHPDWRGKTLADIRRVVRGADRDVVEEWKWMGTPVWCVDGSNICAADIHTNIVKVIFFKGASLADPDKLFNAELEGNMRRAIKLFEGDKVDGRALKSLVSEAIALHRAKAKSGAPKKPAKRAPAKRRAK